MVKFLAAFVLARRVQLLELAGAVGLTVSAWQVDSRAGLAVASAAALLKSFELDLGSGPEDP